MRDVLEAMATPLQAADGVTLDVLHQARRT
jgi:hypothetical protein